MALLSFRVSGWVNYDIPDEHLSLVQELLENKVVNHPDALLQFEDELQFEANFDLDLDESEGSSIELENNQGEIIYAN